MSKKKKNKNISSESKTCFMFAAGFLGVGILLIIFGTFFYHPVDMVKEEDIVTGQTATIVSVDKRDRNLSYNEKERLKEKGYSDDELRWEYSVVYSVDVDGTEYTFDDTKPYVDGHSDPKVGDTDVINYAIKDGKFIPHPETQGTNTVNISGWFLVVLAALAGGVGLFIRKP